MSVVTPLPYLNELRFVTEEIYEPLICRGYNFSGYYAPVNFQHYQMVFCTDCGNYIMANTIDSSTVDMCYCQPIYPKNRYDWRLVSIQETYEKKKKVHAELLRYFLKKEAKRMREITEMIVGLKTDTQILWE